ncbi:MAG: hypothetical protein KDA75_02395 [Planctomycetaceae bacterium]|nr:hypothetical protein [Planctomycetaceae bacterium]
MLNKLLPRKKFFVSGRIQGQLMFRLSTYWVLYHFVLWHAMFAYFYLQHRMSGQVGSISFQELYGSFVLQYYPIILCAVVMMPIFVIDLLKLSHRIAGPLVRFSHGVRGMIAGEEVRRVQLRKGDLLDDFESLFNEYVDVYERRRQQRVAIEKMSERQADQINDVVRTESSDSGPNAAKAVGSAV